MRTAGAAKPSEVEFELWAAVIRSVPVWKLSDHERLLLRSIGCAVGAISTHHRLCKCFQLFREICRGSLRLRLSLDRAAHQCRGHCWLAIAQPMLSKSCAPAAARPTRTGASLPGCCCWLLSPSLLTLLRRKTPKWGATPCPSATHSEFHRLCDGCAQPGVVDQNGFWRNWFDVHDWPNPSRPAACRASAQYSDHCRAHTVRLILSYSSLTERSRIT